MIRRPDGIRIAITGLLALLILTGLGNLLATYSSYHHFQGQYQSQQQAQQRQADQQRAAQQAQGAAVERKLCTTLAKLSALTPPPGDATANPSRAYEQHLHDVLAGLGPDIGCPG